MIPAFFSVDVEPDGFQLSRAAPMAWDGFHLMVGFIEKLRAALHDATGRRPRFGWYFRTDPQIAEVYDGAEHCLRAYPEDMALLARQGDYLGVHMHPIRWSNKHDAWVHDVADPAWLTACTRASLEGFARWAGAPAQRFRSGAAFLSNEIVAALEEHGVDVDLTLEPVSGWGLHAMEVVTAIDRSPLVGWYSDCHGAPRLPYRPSPRDFRVPDAAGREVTLIPLTTGRAADGRPEVLYPGNPWPSAAGYWDRLEHELRSLRRPYVSLALRTDAADEPLTDRVRTLFETLALHPLCRRLDVTDPVEALPAIM